MITLEQEFNTSGKSLWRALTETELMKKWYFDISDFKAEVGFKFQFEGGEKGKRYSHICEVLEVIPFKKLSYSWAYKGHQGSSLVTFELNDLGESAKLKLTHEGLETFTHPDLSQDNFRNGWDFLLKESLKEFLDHGKALRYW